MATSKLKWSNAKDGLGRDVIAAQYGDDIFTISKVTDGALLRGPGGLLIEVPTIAAAKKRAEQEVKVAPYLNGDGTVVGALPTGDPIGQDVTDA